MTDCRDCHYSIMKYGKLQCLAMNLPKPVEYMRDDRSECGIKGVMFEPKVKDHKYEAKI